MNKEIEELLNELKDKYSYEPYDTTGKVYTTISYEEGQLLLSYIEQLENNRDKAIEYIKTTKTTSCPDVTGLEKNSITEFWFVNELENILKGGSDE